MVNGLDHFTQRVAIGISRRNVLKGTVGVVVGAITGFGMRPPAAVAADCCVSVVSACSVCTVQTSQCSCDLSHCFYFWCVCDACNCVGDGPGYYAIGYACDSGAYSVSCNECPN